MIFKERLKAQIDKFPEEELSIDELINRLLFIEKLESRITLSENGGETISQEELKNEIDRWLK